MIHKLKLFHVIFSDPTIIVRCHKMDSTAAKKKQRYIQSSVQPEIYIIEKTIQHRHLKVLVPQTVIYLDSIGDGIILISGPRAETYTLFIQSLQC